ncbi:hypothetical protein QBC36DRAFT_295734 [Triangularia setosa]|uniref:ATPase AAA-type core domain-containing protein n=1 Tax=Triangularia setosa TaxID=2587417 RepID=A0AAN6VYE8_9PEZI|nr:hypothetical protein QBC36DRAFT_295734 [Podospora setosa]
MSSFALPTDHSSYGSAETSADATRKLLLPTSLNNINRDNSLSTFETRLKAILPYVTRWKAILLLDEAGVFLESRSEALGNEERNALVAVFIRNLEFFSGIVFLTTNRVRAFDTAMKSRIHLAPEYSPPGLETRRHLWMRYLGTILPDQIDMDINEDIDELLPQRLNGREISYAVYTAQTLARFEKEKLNLNHLRTVEVRQEFDKSLKKIALRMKGTGLNRTDSILHDETDDFHS